MMISIDILYSHFLQNPVVCTDTRKVTTGCIFFALKGDNFNGNHFASQALDNGAAYTVVSEQINDSRNERIWMVDDVLITLQQLAAHHRRQLKIPVIALTGSNGKTTTKELIHAVLKQRYNVLATVGNLNNHIGVPLTLLSLNSTNNIAVVEMGANHQKEIEQLCEIAQPDQGLITNIGKAHLQGFGGEEGVKKGKGELYDYLRKHDGIIFINKQSEKLVEILKGYEKIISYGAGNNTEYSGVAINDGSLLRVQITKPFLMEIKTQLTGNYNLENVLAAVAVGAEWKVAPEQIKTAIENYTPANQRSQIIKKNNITIILDAYNANPTSVEAALKNFEISFAGKKIVALGDMLELGDESEQEHFNIGALLKSINLHEVILVGPNFKSVAEQFHFYHFNDSLSAMEYFSKMKEDTFTLLIKGSRGVKMEKILEGFEE
jgi:UDP-N-acetylmuramoyl-tripeptide--D-alanyl-D-alanine ligase